VRGYFSLREGVPAARKPAQTGSDFLPLLGRELLRRFFYGRSTNQAIATR